MFELEQVPPQDAVLSIEPVRKGRELSERINALVADLRKGRPVYPQCFVVRQGRSFKLQDLCGFCGMPSDPTALKLCCNTCSMGIGGHTGCRVLNHAAKLPLALLFTFGVSTCLSPHIHYV